MELNEQIVSYEKDVKYLRLVRDKTLIVNIELTLETTGPSDSMFYSRSDEAVFVKNNYS